MPRATSLALTVVIGSSPRESLALDERVVDRDAALVVQDEHPQPDGGHLAGGPGDQLPVELHEVTQTRRVIARPEHILPRRDELLIHASYPRLQRRSTSALGSATATSELSGVSVRPAVGSLLWSMPAMLGRGRHPSNTVEGIDQRHRTGYHRSMVTMTQANRFAHELRRWRTARRVSQLELALCAGTTQRHLSYIEQGRSQPGRGIVLRLAESLELSLRERNALLLAAGYAPVFTHTSLDGPQLRAVREALDRILTGHLPFPAVVVRPYGELVAANTALEVITQGAADHLLTPPVNVLRLALHPDGMAPRVANLPEWGRHIIHNLQAQA